MVEHWRTVKVRDEYLNEIEKLLKTTQGKKLGLVTPGQFVNDAVKKLLEKYETKRFEHFNLYDNCIRVLDSEIGQTGSIIEVFLQNNNLTCDYCRTSNCIHIQYVWTVPKLVKELKKHNIKSPF